MGVCVVAYDMKASRWTRDFLNCICCCMFGAHHQYREWHLGSAHMCMQLLYTRKIYYKYASDAFRSYMMMCVLSIQRTTCQQVMHSAVLLTSVCVDCLHDPGASVHSLNNYNIIFLSKSSQTKHAYRPNTRGKRHTVNTRKLQVVSCLYDEQLIYLSLEHNNKHHTPEAMTKSHIDRTHPRLRVDGVWVLRLRAAHSWTTTASRRLVARVLCFLPRTTTQRSSFQLVCKLWCEVATVYTL